MGPARRVRLLVSAILQYVIHTLWRGDLGLSRLENLVLTVTLMHLLDLEDIPTLLNNVIVSLIPSRHSSKPWTGELGQWMEVQSVEPFECDMCQKSGEKQRWNDTKLHDWSQQASVKACDMGFVLPVEAGETETFLKARIEDQAQWAAPWGFYARRGGVDRFLIKRRRKRSRLGNFWQVCATVPQVALHGRYGTGLTVVTSSSAATIRRSNGLTRYIIWWRLLDIGLGFTVLENWLFFLKKNMW